MQNRLDHAGQQPETTGLLNVHRRLILHFGEQSGLRVGRSEHGGLAVRLMIPCRPEQMGSGKQILGGRIMYRLLIVDDEPAIVEGLALLFSEVFEPIMFMGNGPWFVSILVGSEVWKGMGYNMIIFLAAITGINQNLYEAAEVDGAGKWKQMCNITLPGMAPIIILLATLSIGGILNAGFDQILILYNPTVYKYADVIDTFV